MSESTPLARSAPQSPRGPDASATAASDRWLPAITGSAAPDATPGTEQSPFSNRRAADLGGRDQQRSVASGYGMSVFGNRLFRAECAWLTEGNVRISWRKYAVVREEDLRLLEGVPLCDGVRFVLECYDTNRLVTGIVQPGTTSPPSINSSSVRIAISVRER
jgi:hypothetical protein